VEKALYKVQPFQINNIAIVIHIKVFSEFPILYKAANFPLKLIFGPNEE
jgi:hypothetical protein